MIPIKGAVACHKVRGGTGVRSCFGVEKGGVCSTAEYKKGAQTGGRSQKYLPHKDKRGGRGFTL